MKYSLFTLLIPALFLLPLTSSAQKLAGDYEIGLGVAYGFGLSEDGELGLNVNGYYSVTDEIRLGLDLTWYLTDDDFDDPFYELNLNSNYHIINQEVFRLYALLGLHYGAFVESENANSFESDSEFGLKAGGGLELNFDSIILFTEPTISVRGLDQFSLTIGGRLFF